MSNFGLFDSVPPDHFQFGYGRTFNARRVSQVLNLKAEDVSHLAKVSAKSVRYDEAMPEQVRERMTEIAMTMNMVVQAMDGDVEKATAWFLTANPLLGDVSPRDMIRMGRYDRLRRFIINAMQERSRIHAQAKIDSSVTTDPLPS
jgi:hypothetical protein